MKIQKNLEIDNFKEKPLGDKVFEVYNGTAVVQTHARRISTLSVEIMQFFKDYVYGEKQEYCTNEIMQADMDKFYIFADMLLESAWRLESVNENTAQKAELLFADIENNDSNTNEAVNLTSKESIGEIIKNAMLQRLCEIQKSILSAMGLTKRTNDVSDLVQKCAENYIDECVKSVCWLNKCANELLPELEQAYTMIDFLLSAVGDNDTTNGKN